MAFSRYGRGVRRKPGEMNQLEASYSTVLANYKHAGGILWWGFECIKFRLAPATFYTPDFLVMMENGDMEVHEVKATIKGKPFAMDDAAVKLKVVAEMFPLRFKMIWRLNGIWQTRVIE